MQVDNPKIAKSRLDFDASKLMPKTLLINPSYKNLSDEISYDWEGCLSVKGYVGKVPRCTKIIYEARDVEGCKITKEATGFLVRVLQHEVDHVNGVLFIDLVSPEDLIFREEYIKMRTQSLATNVDLVD